jgi:hypothetical protein
MSEGDAVIQTADRIPTCPYAVIALSSVIDFPFVYLFHSFFIFFHFAVTCLVCGLTVVILHRIALSWLLQTAWIQSSAVSSVCELGLALSKRHVALAGTETGNFVSVRAISESSSWPVTLP